MLVIVLAMVAFACGDAGEGAPSTAGSSTAATTSASTATTPATSATTDTTATTAGTTTSTTSTDSTAATSTTTTQPPGTAAPLGSVLVSNSDGLFVLAADGSDRAVQGSVARGVDDLDAGLVFQTASGPWSRRTGEGNEPRATIIWWVPVRSETPQELLVPTGEQWLTLHDVVMVDGRPHVLYTRLEGTTPETRTETLRLFDIDAKQVTEVAVVAGWEAGTGIISGGDGLYAFEWFAEILSGFDIIDGTGELIDLAANPYAEGEFCEDGILPDSGRPCPELIEIDVDSQRLAYALALRDSEGVVEGFTVEVVAFDGTPVASVSVGSMRPAGLDLAGDLLVVNRYGDTFGIHSQALMFDLATDEVVALREAGEARLLRTFPSTGLDIFAP